MKASDATPQDVEEERRLFYVGVTRARKRLDLLRCKFRMMRGKPMPRTPCRFLSDIPEELVEPFEVKDAAMMSTDAMAEQATNLLAMLDSLGKYSLRRVNHTQALRRSLSRFGPSGA